LTKKNIDLLSRMFNNLLALLDIILQFLYFINPETTRAESKFLYYYNSKLVLDITLRILHVLKQQTTRDERCFLL